MAVLLRELWIPSRVATGYLGGTANPLTGWLVVRASDAHAWVEAWIPGQGWTIYDPTPAGAGWSATGGLWSRLGLYLDAAETFWQEWVVGYDLDRQLTLAFHVDQSWQRGAPWLERSWKRLAGLWKRAAQGGWRQAAPGEMLRGLARPAGVAALLLLGLALAFRRRIAAALARRRAERRPGEPAHAAHEAARLYRGMLAAMHKRGVEKAAFQTAGEFAAGVSHGEAAPLVAESTPYATARTRSRPRAWRCCCARSKPCRGRARGCPTGGRHAVVCRSSRNGRSGSWRVAEKQFAAVIPARAGAGYEM
jgi:hypothetical protein